MSTSGALGGVTGAGPQGGLTAGLAVGGASTGSASGGTSGPGPATGGTSGAELLAGVASSGATAGLGGLAGVAPNGGATLLGHLLAGALPVHPHLDDATGGWLDAYAPADHRHPTSVSGVWRFSTQTTPGDPGPGGLRCDTGLLETATVLWVSSTTEGGTEFPRVEATLGLGDRIYVQDQNDNTRYQGFDLTGDGVHQSTYTTYPVTPRIGVATRGAPVLNNQTVAVVFTDTDGGGAEGPLDYARLLVAATAPPAPEAPSDAFWLNPTEEA